MALKVTPLGSLETTNPEENPGLLPLMFAGAGVPTADLPIGSLYLRSDGGAATTLYVKEATGTTWAVGGGGGGGGLSQGTADTLYTALAPATAARNTITPSAGIPALTIAAPALNAGDGIKFAGLSGTAKWGIHMAAQEFFTVRDDALFIGYNMSGVGTRIDTSENALWQGMEANFRSSGSGPNYMEWNMDYVSAAGVQKRFAAMSVNRSTNLGAWLFLADRVAGSEGFVLTGSATQTHFVFRPTVASTKQCHFVYAGGSSADLQIGYDGTATSPDSISIGPSATADYNGVFIKKTGSSSQVCIGTSTPTATARLTIAGGRVQAEEVWASGGFNHDFGAGGAALLIQNTEVIGRVSGTGIRIANNAFWQNIQLTANGVNVLNVGPLALTIFDAANIVLGTTTGTKIGTATTQKLGFWNATPVVQPTGIANAVVAHAFNVVYNDAEVEAALDALGVKINAVISALESTGLLATV